MVVDKVINNNIVSAFDETGTEVVLMGRGVSASEQSRGSRSFRKRSRRRSGSKARALQSS